MIMELKTLVVYNIPCVCWQVYIGQTKPSAVKSVKEHQWHIRLAQQADWQQEGVV